MIAEILLVLVGHSSSLFTSTTASDPPVLSSDFAPLLHPGEQDCLESLARIAWRFKRISDACRPRQASLITRSGSRYISALCSTLSQILKDEYESLVVETEAKVLQKDDTLVASGSFVPLSAIRAIFSPWDGPLQALDALIKRLEEGFDEGDGNKTLKWPPGPLIDLLLERSHTGVQRISSIISRLAIAVQRIWRIQLTAFLIHGSLSSSDPIASPDYSLRDHVIPSCVSPQTRESIAYVGRAVCTVKAAQWRKQLPRDIASKHTSMLESVLPHDRYAFDQVIAEIRTNVSEWLWSNVLTYKDVDEAVDSLANYFLLRNGEFGLSLIREIERLKVSRLTARIPSRSGQVIRDQDLQLALLRASLGTTAQHDPSLTKLRFSLPSGPLRPLLPSLSSQLISTAKSGIQTQPVFHDLLLGTPLTMGYKLSWPLDLFLHPSDLQIYADLFAYLSSLRKVHTRVLECWVSLSNAQRARRRWTGLDEGGTEDGEGRKELLRLGWGVIRTMSWFLDTLLGYVMTDIVETQFQKLKEQLRPPSTTTARRGSHGAHTERPPTPTSVAASTFHSSSKPQVAHVDFTTLRGHHTAYLENLTSGCLLSNSACASTIRGVLDVCERFVGQVERWGGDVLPALLYEGSLSERDNVGATVRQRRTVVSEINEALNNHLETLYEQLSVSISQPFSTAGDMSSIFVNSSAAQPSLPRPKVKGMTGKDGGSREAETRRHVERLLLRLDFNGEFSRSKPERGQADGDGGILKQGGLA